MKIFIELDLSKLEPGEQALSSSQTEEAQNAIQQLNEDNLGLGITIEASDTIAINAQVKKPNHLKPAVELFNTLAEQYQIDFVLGLIENDQKEEICYFGYEEGKGDTQTIAMYLGI